MKKYQFSKNGLSLTASIPPYVNGMPTIDIDITDEQGGSIRLTTTMLTKDFTDSHLVLFCDALDFKTVQCKVCGALILDRSSENLYSRTADECEKCALKRINEKYGILMAKEQQKEAKRDIKMKTQGYTYKVVAWVHPKQGGDDYQIVLYTMAKPSKKEIQKTLQKEKSKELGDYTVTSL